MLRSTLLITFAAAFATPVLAAPPVASTGTFEGEKFEYSSRVVEGGKIRIEGSFLKRGERFSYTVRPSGLVEGYTGNTPVTFQVSRAMRNRLVEQLKANAEPSFAHAAVGMTAVR